MRKYLPVLIALALPLFHASSFCQEEGKTKIIVKVVEEGKTTLDTVFFVPADLGGDELKKIISAHTGEDISLYVTRPSGIAHTGQATGKDSHVVIVKSEDKDKHIVMKNVMHAGGKEGESMKYVTVMGDTILFTGHADKAIAFVSKDGMVQAVSEGKEKSVEVMVMKDCMADTPAVKKEMKYKVVKVGVDEEGKKVVQVTGDDQGTGTGKKGEVWIVKTGEAKEGSETIHISHCGGATWTAGEGKSITVVLTGEGESREIRASKVTVVAGGDNEVKIIINKESQDAGEKDETKAVKKKK